jgi:Fe-S oxidoreductase
VPASLSERALRVEETVVQVKDTVAVHVPCSSKKMGIEAAFMNLAQRCAKSVKPTAVPCCGMAGDRGMRCAHPPTVPSC